MCVLLITQTFVVSGKVRDPVNQFNHTSWVAIVTPTDHPKSYFCVCQIAFWIFSVIVGLSHRTESDLFLFL